MNHKIGVVLVTYNRLPLLKKALHLFETQTVSPEYILVVNNASTDGTTSFLKEWENQPSFITKYVQNNKTNLGGSGGFYTALQIAQEKEADWIWVSDDDAFPHPNALEKVNDVLNKYQEKEDTISAICGQVNNNHRIDLHHRKRIYTSGWIVVEEKVPEEEYRKEEFELNAFSYVGVVMNRRKLKQAGLPQKDYFIWYDDTEHSLRMSKQGKILCIPSIQIEHNVPERETDILDWKTYYGRRNRMDMIHRHFSGSCYQFQCLKQWLKIHFQMKGSRKAVALAAFKDVRKGTLGMHPVYHPGWKPEI